MNCLCMKKIKATAIMPQWKELEKGSLSLCHTYGLLDRNYHLIALFLSVCSLVYSTCSYLPGLEQFLESYPLLENTGVATVVTKPPNSSYLCFLQPRETISIHLGQEHSGKGLNGRLLSQLHFTISSKWYIVFVKFRRVGSSLCT